MDHHFMSLGNRIEWMATTLAGIPGFIAKKSELEFEVECKYVSFDAGRLVMREVFVRFAAMIGAPLRKLGVMGELKITLNKELPKAGSELSAICDHINNAVANGHGSGTIDVAPWGLANIHVMLADDKVINWDSVQASARTATRNHAHAMVNAESINGQPVNLISVTVNTAERDEYLRTVYEAMMDASTRQLSKEHSGILCIRIPEIKDFAELANNSAL